MLSKGTPIMRLTIRSHVRWIVCAFGLLVISLWFGTASAQTPPAINPAGDWLRDQLNIANIVLLGTFLFHVFGVYFDLKDVKRRLAEVEMWKQEGGIADKRFAHREVVEIRLVALERRSGIDRRTPQQE